MFNMFLICIDDLMYTKGAILGAVSPNNLVTGGTIILMTLVTLAALYFRPKKFARLSWYNVLIIAAFLGGAYFSYVLNS